MTHAERMGLTQEEWVKLLDSMFTGGREVRNRVDFWLHCTDLPIELHRKDCLYCGEHNA